MAFSPETRLMGAVLIVAIIALIVYFARRETMCGCDTNNTDFYRTGPVSAGAGKSIEPAATCPDGRPPVLERGTVLAFASATAVTPCGAATATSHGPMRAADLEKIAASKCPGGASWYVLRDAKFACPEKFESVSWDERAN